MSLEAMTWAFAQDLPPNEKLLLLCLGDYADEDGWCYPGQEKLAKKASMSVATIRRLLGKLVERELIETELRYSPTTGYRTSNGYRLPLNLSDRPTAHRSTVSGRREPSVNEEDTRTREAKATAKPRPKQTPIPDDFEVTPAMREWARSRHPGVDVDAETEKFVNHALANGRMMVDWNATWRTWIANARSYGKPPVQQAGRYGGPRPPAQPTLPPAKTYPKVNTADGFMPAFDPPRMEPPRRPGPQS